MATIMNYFEQAQLSLAAYAQGLQSGMSNSDYRAALVANGMSATQAEEFASTYSVLDQYTDPVSGFSATIFQKGTETFFAIRGTEFGITQTDIGDLLSDAALATGGAAADQIVSMYNYYQRLIHDPGDAVPQLTKIVGDSGTQLYLSSVAGIGLGLQAQMTWPLTVTGHSLGGYLGMAFGRIFNSNVSQLYTYNAPGFTAGGAEAFFNELNDALGISQSSTYLDDSRSTNLFGSGTNIIAGYAATYGADVPVFLEANTHSIAALTDSLAIYSIFAQLAPNAGMDTIATILQAILPQPDESATLERALSDLSLLLGGPAFTNIEYDRDIYYSNVQALQSQLGTSSNLTLTSLVGTAGSTLATTATDNIAYRYALENLLPYVLTGPNSAALYAARNSDGHLDAENFTDQYLTDRSELLSWTLRSNSENPEARGQGDTYYNVWVQPGDPTYYEDKTTGTRVWLGANTGVFSTPLSSLEQVIFGRDGADSGTGALSGGDRADRLYGRGGDDNDTLKYSGSVTIFLCHNIDSGRYVNHNARKAA